jgi:cold shock CspA family protein
VITTGTIRSFVPGQFGFIAADNGTRVHFRHQDVVAAERAPVPGDRVYFDMFAPRGYGGPYAKRVALVPRATR